jgi:hypothetical protein
MKKVFLNDTNRITTTCPKCMFEINIDAKNIKDTHKQLKGVCRCGEAYHFSIEFRKRHRKNVMLPGEYIIQGKEKKGDIIIRELSLSGLRFECLDPHNISKDETLELKFNLNNPLRTEIWKLVNVVWVKNRIVGAHYLDAKLYEKDLGFYLKS